MKGVAEPAIAPDGRSVAFAVTTTDLPAIRRQTNLWRVDADGKGARALTLSDKRDASPAFSPDGTVLAFLSTRAGDPQVFFLPTGGGEAEKKTDVPGGVGGFLFTPDGKRLLVTAEVWPECGADAACNRKKDEAMEKGKMKAYVADRFFVRHWDSWEDGKRTHVLVVDLADAKALLRDLTPGDFDSPAFVVGGGGDFDVSPDGKELVFTSNRDAQPATSTNSDLWVVPIDGSPEALASPRNITASNRAFDGAPRYSPDGRSIGYTMQRVPGYESDRSVLALYDRTSGTSHVLTEGLDNWVKAFRFAPDGKRLYFTADVKGRTPLHSLDLATGKISVVSNVDSPSGRKIQVLLVTDAFRGDAQVYPGAGKVMQDVAAVSDWLAAQPWVDKDRNSSTEELWFPEWDLGGTPWQNPEGYRKQSPSSYVRQFKTPTLVVTGQKDFRVPYTQSLSFFTDLQKMGVPSRLVVFENSSHWPGWYDMVLYYAAHLDWFHTYLGGAPSPWNPKALARNAVFGEKDEKAKP